MEEYESGEEALQRALDILGLTEEEFKAIKPKTVHYEFPEDKTLLVYLVDENIGFAVGHTRFHRGKNIYGLWLVEKERLERV